METTFTPGFTAEIEGDVDVAFLDGDDLPVNLTRGVHFSIALDGAGNVTMMPMRLCQSPTPSRKVLKAISIFRRRSFRVRRLTCLKSKVICSFPVAQQSRWACSIRSSG